MLSLLKYIKIHAKTWLLAIFIIALANACAGDYGNRMSGLLENYLGDQLDNSDLVVLIPGSGCPSCISIAERWVKDHVDDEGLLVVFTNPVSNKLLLGRLKRYGIVPEEKGNVWVDENNTLFLDEYYESESPYAFIVNNGAIVKCMSFMKYVKKQ